MLKAYAVQEEDEGTGGIVFAKTNAQARRIGANRFHEEWDGVTCRRATWADQYAPGPVPFKAMFENGWWQECYGCGVRIEQDGYDDNGNYIDFDIVETAAGIFCTPGCHDRHLIERAKVERVKRRAIAVMRNHLLRRVPGVTIVDGPENWRPHAFVSRDKNGRLRIGQVIIAFDFPGRKHGLGSLRADRDQSHIDRKPTVWISKGDHEIWNAWRAAVKGVTP